MPLMTMKSNLAVGAGVPLGSPSGRHTEGVDVANTMSVGAKVGTDVSLLSATPEKSLAQITSNQTLSGRHTEGAEIIKPLSATPDKSVVDIVSPLAAVPDKKTLEIVSPLAPTPKKPFPAEGWDNDFNTTALKEKFGSGDAQYDFKKADDVRNDSSHGGLGAVGLFKQPYIVTRPNDGLKRLKAFDSRFLPIGSTVQSVLRNAKFVPSISGVVFLAKQIILQKFNPRKETRKWNPLSLGSIVPTFHIDRHKGKMYLEKHSTFGELPQSGDRMKKYLEGSFPDPKGFNPLNTIIERTAGEKDAFKDSVSQAFGLIMNGMGIPSRDTHTNQKGLLTNGMGGTTKYLSYNWLTDNYMPSNGIKYSQKQEDWGDGGFATWVAWDEKKATDPSDLSTEAALSHWANWNSRLHLNGQKIEVTNTDSDSRQEYKLPSYEDTQKIAGGADNYEQAIIKKPVPANTSANKTMGVTWWFGNPGKLGRDKSDYNTDFSKDTGDKVNLEPIIENDDARAKELANHDFVPFRFRYQTSPGDFEIIVFRGRLSGITDSISPQWTPTRFVGRPDNVYVYQGVDRKISFNFDIYPQTKQEMKPLYEKLNALIGLCYPKYEGISSDNDNAGQRMIAPFMKLTIGKLWENAPGYLESLNVSVDDGGTWDLDERLPKFIKVNCGFTYIGDQLPQMGMKHYATDLIEDRT